MCPRENATRVASTQFADGECSVCGWRVCKNVHEGDTKVQLIAEEGGRGEGFH